MNIQEKVNAFKTKYKYGFINSELLEFVSQFPGIDIDKFNNALDNITVTIIDGEMITYKCDIETALSCGIEGRDINEWEFD